jgi:hypothetical protein
VANGVWPDPPPGAYVRANQTTVHPGQSAAQDAGGIQRYVILAYTFSAAEVASFGNQLKFHTYNFAVPADVLPGIDVRIYKNDTLVPPPFTFPAGTVFSDAIFGMDYDFGTVAAGDTLYIALGSIGDYAGQPLNVAYTLALVPEPGALLLICAVPALVLRRRRFDRD